MLTIVDVRTEYRETPLAIDEPRPRFSWRLESDHRNVVQTGYRLRLSLDQAGNELIWDSGEVKREASVHQGYEGPPLAPRTRYWLHVEVRDNFGETAVSRQPTWFETGMGSPEAWSAEWISADPVEGKGDSSAVPLLRRSFQVETLPQAARIYVTALGLYTLYLNGQRVGDRWFTPGWTSYAKRLPYQVFDVTRYLRLGENVIGAMLANGWYAGEIGWNGDRPTSHLRRALLLELHDLGPSKPSLLVGSDSLWQHHSGPIHFSEIYHGETYDARLDVPGWAEPNLDVHDWIPVERVDYGTQTLVAEENLPTRVTEVLAVKAVFTTPAGDRVVDFGQNLTGRVRARWNLPRGATVRLEHAEVLDQEGNFYTENLRKARQTVTYTGDGHGEASYAPEFSFQGFRYVRVTGDFDPVGLADGLVAEVMHSDLERTMTFECSDPLVTRLQQNIVWSQRDNFLEVPTDCPQRDERLGWTGDAEVFIGTASFNMQVVPFFSKWLKDLAADQLPSGSVPHVVPNVLQKDAHGSAAWADAAVICPWVLYTHYGDRRLLERQYPSMRAWVEYMRHTGPRIETFEAGFHYGDWLGLDSPPGSYVGATAIDFITNAFYAHSTEWLAKAAKALGKTADHAEYEDLRQRIGEAFRDEFVTPTGRLAVPTQTAHVLALAFDLVEPAHRSRVFLALRDLISQQNGHLTTGFVGTPYLLPVLSRFGSIEEAYALLLQTDYPSWLYPVTKGATTIWEHWDGIRPDGSFWSPAMNSFNHYAYGAVGEWLYTVVAGLNPREDHPGFQSMRLGPQPGPGLDWVRAEYRSLYGPIEIQWHLSDAHFTLEVSIPANTRATVEFPHAHFTEFESDAEAILHAETGAPWIQIGSGRYHFSYRITPSTTTGGASE